MPELTLKSRVLGCALGACIGDALGMPLEFGPRRPVDAMVRTMTSGRLPAGSFTDDTEMALALAQSLTEHKPLDAVDLSIRFLAWYKTGPSDVGIQTGSVLSQIDRGQPWSRAVEIVRERQPDAAGNGSIMRAWPVALAYPHDLSAVLADSALQSQVTHAHPDCIQACQFSNAVIHFLLADLSPEEAVSAALDAARLNLDLRAVIERAPFLNRDALKNSGWVRHTLESAVWGLVTTENFSDAVLEVVNLGADADTAGTVAGALAGAAYGIENIPQPWLASLRGEWPARSGSFWHAADVADLALRLAGISEQS